MVFLEIKVNSSKLIYYLRAKREVHYLILISTIFHRYHLLIAIVLQIIICLFGLSIIYHCLQRRYTKLHRELYYRDELLHTLCSNIEEIFLIYDIEKQILEYVSPNTDRVLGISPDSFCKDPYIILQYINEDHRKDLFNLFISNIVKTPYETECQIHNPKTKLTKWFIVRISPIVEDSFVKRYICSLSDFSKEKHSQQILKDALLNAQKANNAKKEFLSHMSHEIRTPIYTVIGMTEIALKSLEDQEKVKVSLQKVIISSKQLLALINDILDMSKIDSNKMILSREPFQLSQLLYTLSSIVSTQAEFNQQHFALNITEIKDDIILGDGLRLNQILINCISNALKFTPSGGNIFLNVAEIEKHAHKALYRFIISDNGKGMSEDYIGRIFVPFEQEDNSIVKKYGGSGLGMSITKNLVTLMGGNIHVESKLGLGTKITIDIVFEISTEANIEETKVENPLTFHFSDYRILIVEDNEINLEITCEILKTTDIIIETATDGKKAIQLFESSKPGYYSAILMDVQMPEMNGYEAARIIRNTTHPDANTICIIALTANSFTEDISNTLENGMNYHITKPIQQEKLFSLLQKVITDTK